MSEYAIEMLGITKRFPGIIARSTKMERKLKSKIQTMQMTWALEWYISISN